jgi:hypothetical protein
MRCDAVRDAMLCDVDADEEKAEKLNEEYLK